ncbi:MAG: hypothetical protein AAGU27_11915 [Dehalobacterium sp.]
MGSIIMAPVPFVCRPFEALKGRALPHGHTPSLQNCLAEREMTGDPGARHGR